jgi:hypothetical protein
LADEADFTFFKHSFGDINKRLSVIDSRLLGWVIFIA